MFLIDVPNKYIKSHSKIKSEKRIIRPEQIWGGYPVEYNLKIFKLSKKEYKKREKEVIMEMWEELIKDDV